MPPVDVPPSEVPAPGEASPRRRNAIISEAPILLAYTGLALLLTWPIVLNLSGEILGHEHCTNRMHVWVLWIVKQMLLSGELPIDTSYIFYPAGSDLVRLYGSDMLYPLLLAPLVHLLSPVIVFNLKILFSLTMAPYGVYCLLRYLEVSKPAAWAGGALFIAAPYFLLETFNGVSELVAVEWVPFGILYFMRSQDGGRWRDSLLAGLFFFLATYASGYNAFFLLFFGSIYLAWRLIPAIFRGGWRRALRLKQLALLSALCLVSLGPLKAIHEMSGTSSSVKDEHSDMLDPVKTPTFDSNAELVAFFRPGRNAIPQVKVLDDGHVKRTYTTYTTYLGYGVLALALLGAWRRWKMATLWLLIASFFILVCLGPYLRISGDRLQLFGGSVPMPGLLLYKIVPGFSVTIRHTYRYVAMVHLALGILAALGLDWLLGRTASRLKRAALTAGAAALCITEVLAFGPIPYPLPRVKNTVPDFYHQMAADPEPYPIIELPYEDFTDYLQPFLFYQTVHGKKLIAGAVHYRLLARELAFIYNTPLAKNFMREEDIGRSIDAGNVGRSLRAFKKHGFRYILVHDEMFRNKKWIIEAHDLLSRVFGPPEVKPGGIKLYHISRGKAVGFLQ